MAKLVFECKLTRAVGVRFPTLWIKSKEIEDLCKKWSNGLCSEGFYKLPYNEIDTRRAGYRADYNGFNPAILTRVGLAEGLCFELTSPYSREMAQELLGVIKNYVTHLLSAVLGSLDCNLTISLKDLS